MKKKVIFIVLIFLVMGSYALFNYHRYNKYPFHPGELNKYIVLIDCGLKESSFLFRLRETGPISSILACAIRDKYTSAMDSGFLYIEDTHLEGSPMNTSTHLFLILGDAACTDMKNEDDKLRTYLAANINVLDWLVINFNHGEYTNRAKELLKNLKLQSLDIDKVCEEYKKTIRQIYDDYSVQKKNLTIKSRPTAYSAAG